MPCRGPDDSECLIDVKRKVEFLEAALCGVWDILARQGACDEGVFQTIDYEEAGITEKELRAWRTAHLKKDEERRLREEREEEERRAKEEKEKKIKAIKKKLTKEELKLLGVK